jgi:hypothetical protein
MTIYDNDILEAALIGYEHQKKEIEQKIDQLRAHLGGHVAQVSEAPVAGKRRPFSAATKERMAAAQRRRWAHNNGGEAETAPAKTAAPMEGLARVRATKKAKRTPMSAEGRERIAAAQRKRWAASKKAANKKQ